MKLFVSSRSKVGIYITNAPSRTYLGVTFEFPALLYFIRVTPLENRSPRIANAHYRKKRSKLFSVAD